MTTPSITLANTLNAVPPGDSISTTMTIVAGTGMGRSLNLGDTIFLQLFPPTGITVANAQALSIQPSQEGIQPFNLTLDVASDVAPGLETIVYTWTNKTQKLGPFSGGSFSMTVGFTNTATLAYSILPVPPVTLARLQTGVTGLGIKKTPLDQKVGSFTTGDVTSNADGAVVRTLTVTLPYSCTQQFNGNNALPACTTTRQFYVVSTSGGNAVIGELLYDNGSGEGTVVAVPAVAGRIFVAAGKADFTGGTDEFTAGHYYTWTSGETFTWVDGGTTDIGTSAFQQNFPASTGAQAKPFASFYTSVLGAGLGSVVTAAPVVIA